MKFMVHGPCVSYLIDEKCSKLYPNQFCNQTTFDEHGFALYRRWQNLQLVVVNGQEINNQWVAPYNRDLYIKYDTHINVERVAVCSMVKYLYKYVHKGHNRATIIFESGTRHDDSEQPHSDRQRNENHEYLDCRYISAVESC